MRLLFAVFCLAAVAYPQAPVITSASPATIDAGGDSFTLTVNVTGFATGSVVKWSNTTLVSSYVNDTTIAATVPAFLFATCGKFSVTVTQNNAVSNSYPIVVKPVLRSIYPSSVPAGSSGMTVTATGLGFSSNVYLVLHASGTQTNLATQYGGSTTLAAYIPTSALSGTYPVSLFVADPSTGAVSQTLPITVTATSVTAVYNLMAVSPMAVGPIPPNTVFADIATYGGGSSFTIGVTGTNFVPGAQVYFDSTPLATVYNSSAYLTATVPAALVYDASPDNLTQRIAGISVMNPNAAASNSVSLVILPNPFGTTIASLSPASSPVGGPTFTLTVNGRRYARGSTVIWIQTPLPTTLVSPIRLTATVPADYVAIPGTVPITVSTPGISVSNSVVFPMVVVTPTIALNGVSPLSAVAGGPAFTMTVTGDGFIPASQVIGLAGAVTTYVSQTQLTVNVPASAIATVGTHAIQVQNSDIMFSPQAPLFTVKAPTPAITSLSPASVSPGGGDFTLTVNGSNFLSGATVSWNGAALPSTFVSATQLTAQVSATLIAAAGTANVTVANPGPVSSNQFAFSITGTPAASLASLSPSSAAPGGAGFTLTVAGAGFTNKSTVQWNGAPLATTFVGVTQLTAQVPATLIAAAGTASVTVTGDSGTSNALPFTIALQPPATSTAGILNAASSQPGIAPGTLIAIYGTNLSGGTAQFSTTPLPTLLGQTSVSINGTNAPLLYVSPGQVNAQVPYETKTGTAKLIVTSNGVSGASVNVQVAATAPGVFTAQQSNHVLALNLTDGTLNATQTPARPGQYVTAYLTGQGAVDPPVTTGDVAPASPFSYPVAPVQIRIAGIDAAVPFAGLAPGFIGLLQMNVQIPDATPAGEQSFDVSIGGVAAPSTVISIAPKQ